MVDDEFITPQPSASERLIALRGKYR